MNTLSCFETVRVSKSDLMKALKENLEVEVKKLEVQAEEIITELEEALERVKEDSSYVPSLILRRVVQHSAEFERAIKFVKASLDTDFEITKLDFDRYFLNDWTTARSYNDNYMYHSGTCGTFCSSAYKSTTLSGVG